MTTQGAGHVAAQLQHEVCAILRWGLGVLLVPTQHTYGSIPDCFLNVPEVILRDGGNVPDLARQDAAACTCKRVRGEGSTLVNAQ